MAPALVAEFLGTFWLVLGGCGSAVIAAAYPELGIGFTGVSLAFGLTVLTGAYAFGPISGGHFNPAVSVGLWVGGRFPGSRLLPYVISQLLGAVIAAGVLYLIASGKAGFDLQAGFASNGYGEHSPGQYGLGSALVCEVVMTFMFLACHSWCDERAGTGRLRGAHDRPVSHAHSPGQHPGDEHVGESGAEHWNGTLRRRLGAPAAMALLDRTDRRCRARGFALASGESWEESPAAHRAVDQLPELIIRMQKAVTRKKKSGIAVRSLRHS